MQRRILQTLGAIVFFVLVSHGTAQDIAHVEAGFSPLSSDSRDDAVRAALETGYGMEQRRLWADALVHYEDASRQFPESEGLQERLQIVRIRFDLSRRYADGSYVNSTRQLSVSDSIDLFREVCIKIQSHYVDPPDWQLIVQRGNRNLEIALRDRDFLAVNQVRIPDIEVSRFVRYIMERTTEQHLSDRVAAEQLILAMARVGEQQLGIPAVSAILEYVCGATSSLDQYSTFLTPEQLDDVYSQIEGNFVGLGIELKSSGGSLLITNVIRNGPADRAGIRADDRIIEVDNQSMQDISTDKAADLLKGEQGSVVQVVVRSEDGTIRRLHVRRERVDVPSVERVRMIDPEAGIGYLKLTSFQKTTSQDVDTALWNLQRQGMQSLIIDVRRNPGGLLTQSVEVADKFVTDGTIVSTRGRSPREDFDYKAHRVGTWRVALVVLIDGDSASASEIFAGAIRDHRRGTIVGHRSYGKGSVQGIFPLRIAKTGVRLTTAKFYSPSGHPISNHGVQPDIVVRKSKNDGEASSTDAILAAGIEVARQSLARRSQ